MRQINFFYLFIILLGIAFLFLLRPGFHTDLSFYGFAESNETEINYNYPIVVEKILVTPGQAVKAGEVLMHISRRQSKEKLEDQNYRIAALKAEETVWRQKEEQELAELELAKQTKILELDTQIKQVEKELDFKKSLVSNLKTITPAATSYQPLEEELKALETEKINLSQTYDLQIAGIHKTIQLGNSPYQEEIKRLKAEFAFEESQKVQPFTVTAPSDGLIGNINCKEEEHVPAFTTLLSFYEPHSGLIKGYVHEDLTLQVQIGDQFRAASLKDPSINYEGEVIGLGSRIVEIPTRLRRVPEIKSYGREVLVQITTDNRFLQKEKVSLSFISSSENVQ